MCSIHNKIRSVHNDFSIHGPNANEPHPHLDEEGGEDPKRQELGVVPGNRRLWWEHLCSGTLGLFRVCSVGDPEHLFPTASIDGPSPFIRLDCEARAPPHDATPEYIIFRMSNFRERILVSELSVRNQNGW